MKSLQSRLMEFALRQHGRRLSPQQLGAPWTFTYRARRDLEDASARTPECTGLVIPAAGGGSEIHVMVDEMLSGQREFA